MARTVRWMVLAIAAWFGVFGISCGITYVVGIRSWNKHLEKRT